MILVLLTLMSDQPLVHEGGRLEGRQSGRKCGDVDDYLSDHGKGPITIKQCFLHPVGLRYFYLSGTFIQDLRVATERGWLQNRPFSFE